MRVVLLVFLAFASCEDDGPLDSERDMAMQKDLSVAGTTCAAAVQCSMACTTPACSGACFANVSADSMPYSQALLTCIQNKCTSAGGDAGTPACDDPNAATCGTCVQSKCLAEATACLGH
jgi:hypothetical protein